MWANNKRLKKQVIDLRLPWWLKLVKSGIPYAIAATTSIVVMLTLSGYLAMPESIQLLKWVEALFMAMSPAVKFLAVTSIGLGSFLSTFEIFSVFIRGFLYHYAEKAASEGLEVAEQLAEQNKELRDTLCLQMKLNEQFKNQSELLKGYAKGLHVVLNKKASDVPNSALNFDELKGEEQQTNVSGMNEPEHEPEHEPEYEEDAQEEDMNLGQSAEHNQEDDTPEPQDTLPKQPEPVLFSAQREDKQKAKKTKGISSHSRSSSMMFLPREHRRHSLRGNFTGQPMMTKKHRSKKKLVQNGV